MEHSSVKTIALENFVQEKVPLRHLPNFKIYIYVLTEILYNVYPCGSNLESSLVNAKTEFSLSHASAIHLKHQYKKKSTARTPTTTNPNPIASLAMLLCFANVVG